MEVAAVRLEVGLEARLQVVAARQLYIHPHQLHLQHVRHGHDAKGLLSALEASHSVGIGVALTPATAAAEAAEQSNEQTR